MKTPMGRGAEPRRNHSGSRTALVVLAMLAAPVSTVHAQQPPEDEPDDATPAAADRAPTFSDDVPLPPRLEDSEPNTARLAPLPEGRRAPEEEVVVIGTESEWRLPDLGSNWRVQQEEEARRASRIDAAFLPLYDPEAEALNAATWPIGREAQRAGYIELFRIRFGRRSRN